jgi:hypothetical protein
MLCPQVSGGIVNVLNRQFRITDRGWSFSLSAGQGLTRPQHRNRALHNVTQGHGVGRFIWNDVSNQKQASALELGRSGVSAGQAL